MAKRNLVAFCALIISVGLFSGCKKFEKEGHMNEPGIVLTFDDDRVDNWYSFLPLFDSLGVKATFYICKYTAGCNICTGAGALYDQWLLRITLCIE